MTPQAQEKMNDIEATVEEEKVELKKILKVLDSITGLIKPAVEDVKQKSEAKKEIDLPEFVKPADEHLRYLFTRVWTDDELKMQQKLNVLDKIFSVDSTPHDIRKEYRKFRFPLDKSTIPILADKDTTVQKDIVDPFYRGANSLDEFAQKIWDVRGAFTDRTRLSEWIAKECLDYKE
ncbi:hypothetical protein WR25_10311 [Diploscapter pachys]|uniref:Uncharacterized protein n=1 Tax=Diploscapter pachys TaxID=2018661 RepID=A0A2A2KY98_9BILA|nr:hypothetical protein WR25_10311 [Diploscapter pachys]